MTDDRTDDSTMFDAEPMLWEETAKSLQRQAIALHDEADRLKRLLDQRGKDAADAEDEVARLRTAVALHARTLDDRAFGHPEHLKRNRDDIDNDLYNAVRVIDPTWWDARVPGLAITSETGDLDSAGEARPREDRPSLHGKLQWARGLCTDERDHAYIDVVLSEAVDLAKDLEAERDRLKREFSDERLEHMRLRMAIREYRRTRTSAARAQVIALLDGAQR